MAWHSSTLNIIRRQERIKVLKQSMTELCNEAWSKGYLAAERGKKLSNNPYDAHIWKEEYSHWRAGFLHKLQIKRRQIRKYLGNNCVLIVPKF